MISVEGDFVRTWWYGRRRIRHKARKYRRFGGVRIILGWHSTALFGGNLFHRFIIQLKKDYNPILSDRFAVFSF